MNLKSVIEVGGPGLVVPYLMALMVTPPPGGGGGGGGRSAEVTATENTWLATPPRPSLAWTWMG